MKLRCVQCTQLEAIHLSHSNPTVETYTDDPNPEYEPYINKPKIVNTAMPPTQAINHNGMRPPSTIYLLSWKDSLTTVCTNNQSSIEKVLAQLHVLCVSWRRDLNP